MKRLLLVGGGHAHVEVLRRLGLERPGNLEIVLLSPDPVATYSGMIPGVIAGDYRIGQCCIDLQGLARRSGARWQAGAATGINPDARSVRTSAGEMLEYDLVSFDVGSIPAQQGIPGVIEHAIPVRPAAQLLKEVERLASRARGGKPAKVVVAGAGAAGTEIALTLCHRLLNESSIADKRVSIQVITESSRLLAGFSTSLAQRAERLFGERDIAFERGVRVVAVSAEGLTLSDGRSIEAGAVIWATGAAAMPWMRESALATDAGGFIAISTGLQSLSHPQVFAAGDCASCVETPWPKSGVFAVRQGPVLAHNLVRALRGAPLAPLVGSNRSLAILNCGGRRALADWRGHVFEGNWVWHWKDWLDQRFLRRYVGQA